MECIFARPSLSIFEWCGKRTFMYLLSVFVYFEAFKEGMQPT